MAITQETQVANVANGILAVMAGLASMQQTINQLSAQWTNLSVATALNAFPTAAQTTLGSLGTADGSPNVAHPIDTRTADGALINRAISANNFASMMTFIQGISSAIGGTAIGSNGAAPSLIALSL